MSAHERGVVSNAQLRDALLAASNALDGYYQSHSMCGWLADERDKIDDLIRNLADRDWFEMPKELEGVEGEPRPGVRGGVTVDDAMVDRALEAQRQACVILPGRDSIDYREAMRVALERVLGVGNG